MKDRIIKSWRAHVFLGGGDRFPDANSGKTNARGSRPLWIGEVRGCGLYIGVELVLSKTTKEPATTEAQEIIERLKVKIKAFTHRSNDTQSAHIKLNV